MSLENRLVPFKCKCGEEYKFDPTKEWGNNVAYVKINWCVMCIDDASEPYEEVPVYIGEEELDVKVDDNQTSLEL